MSKIYVRTLTIVLILMYTGLNYVAIQYIEIREKNLGQLLTILDGLCFFALIYLIHRQFKKSIYYPMVFPGLVFIGILSFSIWSLLIVFLPFGSNIPDDGILLFRNRTNRRLIIHERIFNADALAGGRQDTVVSQDLVGAIRFTVAYDSSSMNWDDWRRP